MKEITIRLNGSEERVPAGTKVSDLFSRFPSVNRVVAEVNGEIVYEPSERELRDGDVVEIVSFVGGG